MCARRSSPGNGQGGIVALDLAIRGGLVADGSGAAARHADIGVRGGRIVQIGRLDESARRVIDASGLITTILGRDPKRTQIVNQ